MLRIHTITSATDAKRYYAAADYYSQGQETLGRWGGKLAERLGLSGTVDQASFERLCDNLHPLTGEKLTPRTNDDRRVGYDFTFSAPKSFSIVEALADEAERQRLLAAFDDAIRETMREEVEPDVHTRVRLAGAREDRKTSNMVWAEFDHSTARPVDGSTPDPHRHRHVVAFNATYDPVERRIKAGEWSAIKRDGEYFAAVFYSKLAGKLEGMGYAIDRRGGKEWEIAGLPQQTIDRFSKRTSEVEAEHAERLLTDPDYRPGNKHELGAKTRSKKQKELTQDELRTDWRKQLPAAERHALANVYGKQIAASPAVTAREAVAFAIAHCSERESVVPERELKRVALLHGLGHVSGRDVAAELPRHGVIVREFDGRQMATTKALQAEESAIVGFVANGRGSVAPVGVPEGLERGQLNDGQWQAVTGLLASSNRVNLVEGPAGAGKSFMLAAFDQGMRRAGKHVTYLGTTTDSVEVLKKDNFEANTLARFLLDPRMQEAAQGGYVVLDETSLMGHRDAVRLCQAAQKHDLRLIFVGDAMQHGSVGRGAFLRILKEYGGIKPFRLEEIRRQEEPGYLEAVKRLSEGKTAEGFDLLARKSWVHEVLGSDERYRAMAVEYLQALADKKSVLIVSPTHAEAKDITNEIRSQLRAAGRLGAEDRAFTRLVAVNATEAERGLTTTYRPGDVIQFHQNAKGFKKGERFIVSDPAKAPVAHAAKFSLYRPEKIALAEGDRLRITGTVKTVDGKHALRNGAMVTVAGFTAKGGIRLENDWVIGDAEHFRHGFVDTSFAAQGKTVQRVILGMAADSLGATNREQMYVSSSRAKERLSLYTDDAAAVRRGIERSSQKLAALDIQPPALKPAPKRRWNRLRLHMDRVRRQAIDRVRTAWEAPARPQPEVSYGR